MKPASSLIALFHAAAILIFASASVQARAPHAARSSPPVSQIQVDGIISGVTDQLWLQTDEYFHTADFPRIVALDRIITEADPQFLEAYATGGWMMDSLGRRQDAEAFYLLATRRNPHTDYGYWTLGMFYFSQKHDYEAAVAAFHRATEQPDADLNDWKMLGHSLEKAGEWDKAVATWHQIKARWSNGSSVDRLLAEAEEKRRQAQADGSPSDGKPRP